MSPMSGVNGLITHASIDGSSYTLQVQSMSEIFPFIFRIFLILGTIVGIVVIGYMLYTAYRYRESAAESADDADRPRLGELPTGGGGGKKLALSLTLSAIIVIGLIAPTYVFLRDVEAGPSDAENPIEIKVTGYQFGWTFTYPNGYNNTTLRVPTDRPVKFSVTSRDVMHNFGIPAFNFKTDAIKGQTTDGWIDPETPGTYQAQCFELCGTGHSQMDANVIVMKPDAYEKWYADTGTNNASSGSGSGSNNSSNGTSSNSMITIAEVQTQ